MPIQGLIFFFASLISWAAINLMLHSIRPTLELFDYIPSKGRLILRRAFFFLMGMALLQASWGIFYLAA